MLLTVVIAATAAAARGAPALLLETRTLRTASLTISVHISKMPAVERGEIAEQARKNISADGHAVTPTAETHTMRRWMTLFSAQLQDADKQTHQMPFRSPQPARCVREVEGFDVNIGKVPSVSSVGRCQEHVKDPCNEENKTPHLRNLQDFCFSLFFLL